MKKKILYILLSFIVILIIFSNKIDVDSNLDKIFLPMSYENLLGTDNLGRDIFSLLIFGGIQTIKVVFIASSFSFIGGIFLGLISGYFENSLSACIKVVVDLMMIIPSLILAIIVTSIFGITPLTAGLSLGLYGLGNYMNQAEALTKQEKEKEYVEASIVLGTPWYVILFKGIFLNIIGSLLINLGNTAGHIVLQYSSLTFIGLGTDYTKPDWGTLLYQYRVYLVERPVMVLLPVVAIFLLALCLNFLFDKE